jgi:hypothetical protein
MRFLRRGARSVRTKPAGGLVMGLGCTALLFNQGACPLVGALAKYAPTPEMLAAIEANGGEECAPCTAGTRDCLQELVNWLEAQLRGDDTVPFPSGECAG